MARKYTHAGVWDQYCYCDHHSPEYARADPSMCSFKCPGDSSKNCGGDGYNSVAGPGYPSTPAYCVHSSSFPEFQISSYNMTPSACMPMCSSRGFQYAGLEYLDCHCGSSQPPSHLLVEDSGCNKACFRNPGLVCGGRKKFSVFKLNTTVKGRK